MNEVFDGQATRRTTFKSTFRQFDDLLKQENLRGMMNLPFNDLKLVKLDALQKYQQSGKFPFKVLLQVVLTLIISFQVFFILKTDMEFVRRQLIMLKSNFLGLDEPDFTLEFYTVDQTLSGLRQIEDVLIHFSIISRQC